MQQLNGDWLLQQGVHLAPGGELRRGVCQGTGEGAARPRALPGREVHPTQPVWPAWPVPPGGTLHLGHTVVRVGRRPCWPRPRSGVPTHLSPTHVETPSGTVWHQSPRCLVGKPTGRNPYLTSLGCPPPGPLQVDVHPKQGRGAWASLPLALQGGIPLLAAGGCDAVHACAGLRWPRAAGHGCLPAVGTALLLHGHVTHPALSPTLGHCHTAHSPWACLLDHIDHR